MTTDLGRFLEAQETMYETALSEIKSGKKQSHWMWYIFPQIAGLGFSETAQFYAIQNLKEATEYLDHAVLGNRLREISAEVLRLEGRDANEIFGFPDDLKLHSSMTLFAFADQSEDNVFQEVLKKYFDRKMDEQTVLIVGE
ncbi:Uncharacterized conserved protein [Chryseobacterium taklimakanense]|uniref:Uncharacterized conserved protein n=1 Tax=Chryseobacterium taklimakanense TaxID=536441 RepID=A0A239X4P2_9FLAO|nr:DUF1810 domain-containing protein [Chryseobacterium taklimakanense]SNV41665.1 Uncharacterized conserved protein [Chryseobacterium taklimakanense]